MVLEKWDTTGGRVVLHDGNPIKQESWSIYLKKEQYETKLKEVATTVSNLENNHTTVQEVQYE